MTHLDETIVDFVKVLRTADVKVSPAETLDAMEALEIIGLEDKVLLKNSLSMVLSKNPEEKKTFNTTFDKFFSFETNSSRNDSNNSEKKSDQEEESLAAETNGENKQNDEGSKLGQSGEYTTQIDEEQNFDQLKAQSELGKLLLSGDQTEITIQIAQAGRHVEINQIVVFTQKGLFTRKIMETMGLKGLQDEVSSLQDSGERPEIHLANQLKTARDILREQVRDYVEKQFFLHADETGKELREELLKKVKLSNLEK